MTDQNFHSDSHKDNAADELGPETAAESTAKTNAKEVARETEEERNQPDDDQWEGKAAERAVARKGECYAYSQCVNARCDGQKELRFQAHGVEMLCFFGQKRLANHASTDERDRKSTRLNSSHANISYAVFCLKKKHINIISMTVNDTLIDTTLL